MVSVSVVIPTYNRKTTLARAVESVLSQDHSVSEIIIVDDCSTDGSADLPLLAHERITYLVNDRNMGSQASRNRGIQVATGDAIAFLDSDDYWRADKIEQQVKLAESSRAGADYCVTCGHRQFGDEGDVDFVPPKMINLETVMVHNLIGPTSNILISRSLLDAVGHFDTSMPSCQDWELFVRVLERVPILGVPEIMTFQDTESNARISSNRKKVIAGHQALYRRARETGIFKSLPFSRRWTLRARQEYALIKRNKAV